MICLNTCNNRADESYCQIRCGDLFENDAVGKFNACAVSKKKCVKQRQVRGDSKAPFLPTDGRTDGWTDVFLHVNNPRWQLIGPLSCCESCTRHDHELDEYLEIENMSLRSAVVAMMVHCSLVIFTQSRPPRSPNRR